MRSNETNRCRVATLCALVATAAITGVATAAPVTDDIDAGHTYPSFEADHMGISVWRGKFDCSKGTVVLDKAAGTGSVEVAIDLASIDFGQHDLDTWAKGKDLFETGKFPNATYKDTLAGFSNGVPSKVVGERRFATRTVRSKC